MAIFNSYLDITRGYHPRSPETRRTPGGWAAASLPSSKPRVSTSRWWRHCQRRNGPWRPFSAVREGPQRLRFMDLDGFRWGFLWGFLWIQMDFTYPKSSKNRDFHGISEMMVAFMMGFRWIYKPKLGFRWIYVVSSHPKLLDWLGVETHPKLGFICDWCSLHSWIMLALP